MASVQSDTGTPPIGQGTSGVWPPDIAKFIAAEVAQGEYASEGDLVYAALRHFRDRSGNRLRKELQDGLDELNAEIAMN